MDDGVCEQHGVVGRVAGFSDACSVWLVEKEGGNVALTPAEARYLASKLHRLAQRAEKRIHTGTQA